VHLIVSLSVSYAYLIKFHDFAHNSQEEMKHEMTGCNSGPTGHDFTDNFIGPWPHRDRDYRILSNFWKFCFIQTGFTLGEPVFLVKVFKLFRLKRIFLCSECGHNR
jgi:hypothetical protein